jgi:hypothetical protein
VALPNGVSSSAIVISTSPMRSGDRKYSDFTRMKRPFVNRDTGELRHGDYASCPAFGQDICNHHPRILISPSSRAHERHVVPRTVSKARCRCSPSARPGDLCSSQTGVSSRAQIPRYDTARPSPKGEQQSRPLRRSRRRLGMTMCAMLGSRTPRAHTAPCASSWVLWVSPSGRTLCCAQNDGVCYVAGVQNRTAQTPEELSVRWPNEPYTPITPRRRAAGPGHTPG